MNGEITLRQTK